MKILEYISSKTPDQLSEKLKEREEIRKVKAAHKLTKKENQQIEKKREKSLHEKYHWYNFFTKWFFIGIILVLISVLLDLCVDIIPDQGTINIWKFPITILAGILSTFGIALFVGCIFDFSKNSEALTKI